MKIRTLTILIPLLLGLQSSPSRAETVWYPLPAEAYQFAQRYPEAQHLLFAFDYGHAILYERLLLSKGKITNPQEFEKSVLTEIFGILRNPPIVKTSEEDIAPNYTFTFPLILNLFDWSHDLHQFLYDIIATSQDRGLPMGTRVQEIYNQYKASPSIAIAEECKTMLFMDGHYFSKSFRRTFPNLNLLIWSYHWLQIRLYDDLLKPSGSERDQSVAQTVKRFWNLVSDLPDSADFDMMPETAKEAPVFTKAYPKIAAVFDNLHMLHDVVSDILVSEKVAPESVRSEGIRFARMGQDPNAFKAAKCSTVN